MPVNLDIMTTTTVQTHSYSKMCLHGESCWVDCSSKTQPRDEKSPTRQIHSRYNPSCLFRCWSMCPLVLTKSLEEKQDVGASGSTRKIRSIVRIKSLYEVFIQLGKCSFLSFDNIELENKSFKLHISCRWIRVFLQHFSVFFCIHFTLTRLPEPAAEKRFHSEVLPPACLRLGKV